MASGKTVVLRVVGKDTGADLDGVEVFGGNPGMQVLDGSGSPLWPAVVPGARSPVVLDPSLDGRPSVPYWVRATGYAWGELTVDAASGGERRIALDRAASLEVRVRIVGSGLPPADAKIWLLEAPSPEEKAALIAEVRRLRGKPAVPGESASLWGLLREALDLVMSGERSELLERILQRGSLEPRFQVIPSWKGVTVLDNLPPGHWAVQVGENLLMPGRGPDPLGEAEVLLEAGRRGRATIAVKGAPPPPDLVFLAGTLLVPEGWETAEIRIERAGGPLFLPRTIPLARMLGVPGKPGTYRWSAGQVPPGRYRVLLRPTGQMHDVEVGPEGRKDLALEILPPCEVTVRVVEAATGRDAPVEGISWGLVSREGEAGDRSWSALRVERKPGASGFSFQAPAGEIHLDVASEHYLCVEGWGQFLELRPGRNEFTLRVKRDQGIDVVFKDGETIVPPSMSQEVSARRIDGPGETHTSGLKGPALRLSLSQPGMYEVTFDSIGGFRPVPPLRAEVRPGEFTEVVVPLERDPLTGEA